MNMLILSLSMWLHSLRKWLSAQWKFLAPYVVGIGLVYILMPQVIDSLLARL